MKKYLFLMLPLLSLALVLISCKKYLERKPDKSLVIPSTVADVQALLDSYDKMNMNCPLIAEGSSDNYYLTDADFNALTAQRYKDLYTWGEEIVSNTYPNDWSNSYDPVYYTNIALETLPNIERNKQNGQSWDNAKGSALFFRAKCFLSTVTLWAKSYDSSKAATDPGIPLRLSSDFNIPSTRASVQETYTQVINDLKNAIPLLPETPAHVFRPSKAAAYALLSRTFLYVQDYAKAGKYADSALMLHNYLLDFNTLNAAANAPIARFNPEVIIHFTASSLSFIRNRIDSVLYSSYDKNDLRKLVFFKKNVTDDSYSFKGSYDGSTAMFCGIATDEMLLTRAECSARAGDIVNAMNDLNTLLQKRWKTGTYIPYTAQNSAAALDLILTERRKELLLRHLRWADIKRLNVAGAGIVLTRKLNGQFITLPPNDNRYALPIPSIVIAMTGMEQNQR